MGNMKLVGSLLNAMSRGCSLDVMIVMADAIARMLREEQARRLESGAIGVGLVVLESDL